MNLIAHRGLQTKNTKENTLTAMLLGNNNNKISGIELDVRLTKDYKVVVIHDEYIDRVSDGSGKVREMTLSRLKSFNYGTNIKHSTISTLEEILDKLYLNGLIIIDLKDEFEKNNILASKVLDVIKNYPELKIWLKSSSLDVINYLKRYSNAPVGLLIDQNNINNLYVDVDFYSISTSVINRNIINSKIAQNKKIMVWNINTKEQFYKLEKEIGGLIENIYIISDNPFICC